MLASGPPRLAASSEAIERRAGNAPPLPSPDKTEVEVIERPTVSVVDCRRKGVGNVRSVRPDMGTVGSHPCSSKAWELWYPSMNNQAPRDRLDRGTRQHQASRIPLGGSLDKRLRHHMQFSGFPLGSEAGDDKPEAND